MKKKLTKEQKRQQANNARKNPPIVIHLNSIKSEKVRKFMSDCAELVPFHEAAHMVLARKYQPQFSWAYGKLGDGQWGCIPDGNPLMKGDANTDFAFITAAGYAGELAALGISPYAENKHESNPEFIECMVRLYGDTLKVYRLAEQGLLMPPLMNDDFKLVTIFKNGHSDSEVLEMLIKLTGIILNKLLFDPETNAEWQKEVDNFKKFAKAA